MPDLQQPLLSVIVVMVGDTVRFDGDLSGLAGTLEALCRQANPPRMEVIVPYRAGLRDISRLERQFPSVTFLGVNDLKTLQSGNGSREHHDELRARGAAIAHGEIIACLEDHVRPGPRWAASMVSAHQQPYAAVGGAIENGIDQPINWGVYFCDLGKYQNPVPAGESSFASTVNIAYKRSALNTIRPVWQDRFNETEVNTALVSRGQRLALTPDAVVYQHRDRLQLGLSLREFYVWGRSYARIRSRLAGSRRRAIYALLAPALPLVLLARMAVRVRQKRRHAPAFVRALPFTALFVTAWSAGELSGYLSAPRNGTGLSRATGGEAMSAMHDAEAETAPALPEARRIESVSVSIVIAWVNPLDLLVPGLDVLLRPKGKQAAEIIVVTRHDATAQDQLRKLYPEVTLLAAPPNTPITTLRSIGIQAAKGNVVAITEDHCIPCSDWVARIESAMLQGYGVVGGPVENASTRRLLDWAAFLTEYAGAIKGAGENDAVPASNGSLPGNNVAYWRDLWAGLSATLAGGRWESFYHQELAQQGVPMLYDPNLVVYHRRPFDFRYFVGQRYHFCRSFADMRCRSAGWTERLRYGFGSFLLPPMLALRGLSTIRRKRRFLAHYLFCLPLIDFYIMVGAAGEMTGYFLGGGHSEQRIE